MVRFKELKISSNGKCFSLMAAVDGASYYTERFITDIYIDSELTFNNSTTPSDKAVHVSLTQNGVGVKSYSRTFTIGELSKIISSKSLKDHILFVFVDLEGALSGDVPCGSDNDRFLGIAVDWDSIHHRSLGYMKQITRECCSVPKEFIDYILRIKALELALKTGHYMVAKDLWFKFFSKRKKTISSICGCNK